MWNMKRSFEQFLMHDDARGVPSVSLVWRSRKRVKPTEPEPLVVQGTRPIPGTALPKASGIEFGSLLAQLRTQKAPTANHIPAQTADLREDAEYAAFVTSLARTLDSEGQAQCIFVRGAIGCGKRIAVQAACGHLANKAVVLVGTIDALAVASLAQFKQAIAAALVPGATLHAKPIAPGRRVLLVRHVDVSPMLRSIKPNELAKALSAVLRLAGTRAALVLTMSSESSYRVADCACSTVVLKRAPTRSVDAVLRRSFGGRISLDGLDGVGGHESEDQRWTRLVCAASSDGDLRRAVAQYHYCHRFPSEAPFGSGAHDAEVASVLFYDAMRALSCSLSPQKQAAYLIDVVLKRSSVSRRDRRRLMTNVARARKMMHETEHLSRQISVSRAADIACQLGITLPWISLHGTASLRALLLGDWDVTSPPGFHTVHRYHLITKRFAEQTRSRATYAAASTQWTDPLEDSQFLFGYAAPVVVHHVLHECQRNGESIARLVPALESCGSAEMSWMVQSHTLNRIRNGSGGFYSRVRKVVADASDRVHLFD